MQQDTNDLASFGIWEWRDSLQDLEFKPNHAILKRLELSDTMSTGTAVHMHLRYQEPEKNRKREMFEYMPWLPSCVPFGHPDHTKQFAQVLASQFAKSTNDSRLRIVSKLAHGDGQPRRKESQTQKTRANEEVQQLATNVANVTKLEHGGGHNRSTESQTQRNDAKEEAKQPATKVTLDHIKAVALSRLSTRCRRRKKSLPLKFEDLINKTQFDDMLRSTLIYIDSFLKLKVLEKKELQQKKENMVTAIEDKMAIIDGRADKEIKHRLLGEKYCMLVLGFEIPAYHHTETGKWRTSKTRADRTLYEAIYEFLVLATWLTFRQQHWQWICEELGRIFRSDLFNVQKRLCGSSSWEDNEDIPWSSRSPFLRPYNSSKKEKRRYCALISGHTPILASVLPTTKEAAAWLFSSYLERQKRSRSCPPSLPSREQRPSFPSRLGIIGEPLCTFDVNTLSLVHLEDCDGSGGSSVQFPNLSEN